MKAYGSYGTCKIWCSNPVGKKAYGAHHEVAASGYPKLMKYEVVEAYELQQVILIRAGTTRRLYKSWGLRSSNIDMYPTMLLFPCRNLLCITLD